MIPDKCLHGESSVDRVKCIRNDQVPRVVFRSRDVRRPKERRYIDEECVVRHVASHADPEVGRMLGTVHTGIVDRSYLSPKP